jgi:hypothetical protein
MTTRAGLASNLACTLLVLALLAGCATPHEAPEKKPVTGPQWKNLAFELVYESRSAEESPDTVADWKKATWQKEMEFFDLLLDKPLASTADAVKAVTLFTGEPPWDIDVDELAAKLLKKEIIEDDWIIEEAEPLTKGKISYMICQALDIRGGIWMTIFGPSERYCSREAVYLDLVSAGSLHLHVTGEELLNVLSQAVVYRDLRGTGSDEG